MGSPLDALPPGTDLCQLPTGNPPPGQSSDLTSSDLKSLTISLSVILATIAVIFGLGRLYVNIRKLTMGDFFVFIAVISNVITVVLMVMYAKYFRHIWNLPLCWIDDQYRKITYILEMLVTFSIFPARAATLLLFHQLFIVSRPMSIAIWIGMVISIVITVGCLGVLTYSYAVGIGDQSGDANGTITFWMFQLSIAGAALDTLIDIYIFILPLPIISKLNLSKKKKLQVSAIFFIALLAIAASILSLVYRVEAVQSDNNDSTYNTAVVLICSLIQMNVTLIICSATAFVRFVRHHILELRIFNALRSTLGASSSLNGRRGLSNSWQNPNHPRTGRDVPPNQKQKSFRSMVDYAEVSDTWLLNSGAAMDTKGQKNTA
ncbi:uncharacterized protein F4812DRAFT_438491 [Daldinia caldariorum]|uniref:uncharacterized protein n=1 Tax=Daldinia caldariorum TaxID=326644 RepID=UPI00200880CC|nr:uncharacterized protein F4812DRAFT_438491 [Daldinia caldariorum]KAI1465379.1 hypothetical protein F4812DRAFT_438491 [Daldinia caldariorum]